MSICSFFGMVFRESLFVGLLWNWLVNSCIEVFFLVGIILALQRLLRSRLSLHWSYYLWVFVLLRLVFSFVLTIFYKRPGLGLNFSAVSCVLFWLWGIGMVVVFLSSFMRAWIFLRCIAKLPEIEDPDIRKLFDDCCERLSMGGRVRLVFSPELDSPASAGVFRPHVLLPQSALEAELSMTDLRFIFLHELSHLKRFDLFMRWISFSLRMVFWFHPVVWYALWKMESDCELNADALALSFLEKDQKYDYGKLLLRSMQKLSGRMRKNVPELAGFCATGVQVKRRIKLISAFNSHEMRFVPHLDFIVIILLGLLVFNLPGQKIFKVGDKNKHLPIESINHMDSNAYILCRALYEYVPAGRLFGQSFVANNTDIVGVSFDIGKEKCDAQSSLITEPVDLVLFEALPDKGGYVLTEITRKRFFPEPEKAKEGRQDFLFSGTIPLIPGQRYVVGLESHGLFSIKLRNPYFSTYPHGSAVTKSFLSRRARKQVGGRDYLFKIYSSCEPQYEYMSLYSPDSDEFLVPLNTDD